MPYYTVIIRFLFSLNNTTQTHFSFAWIVELTFSSWAYFFFQKIISSFNSITHSSLFLCVALVHHSIDHSLSITPMPMHWRGISCTIFLWKSQRSHFLSNAKKDDLLWEFSQVHTKCVEKKKTQNSNKKRYKQKRNWLEINETAPSKRTQSTLNWK